MGRSGPKNTCFLVFVLRGSDFGLVGMAYFKMEHEKEPNVVSNLES